MQGLLEGYLTETVCPKYPHHCPQQGPAAALKLTRSTVKRTAFFLQKDEHDVLVVVERLVEIALARCPVCKSRYRVLPADILARKLYSLSVIELSVSLYNRGNLSLREVVWEGLYGERSPMHTTLHGWTEGLGAYCLGRSVGELPWGLPAARVFSELQCRYGEMGAVHQSPLELNPQRYRSQGRRERLLACKHLELCCGALKAEAPGMFCELNRLIVAWDNSWGLGFRSTICCTAIEQLHWADVGYCFQDAQKEPLPCPIHGRSPPGDSR